MRNSVFLSTPSARRATFTMMDGIPALSYFYPRPPRGGRQTVDVTITWCFEFLSTPSARRATTRWEADRAKAAISIHALREEGDKTFTISDTLFNNFYPRPPRGGRRELYTPQSIDLKFLSTPSARRATRRVAAGTQAVLFLSTPSARRATWEGATSAPTIRYFYPRPPRGGRPLLWSLQT